ncbi:hypothetical protein Btru_030446 [Bulinus truncatus]|nr:hypothetical protein Btru_030446 [Bulinus truncatus]
MPLRHDQQDSSDGSNSPREWRPVPSWNIWKTPKAGYAMVLGARYSVERMKVSKTKGHFSCEYFLTLAVGAVLTVYSFSVCYYIHNIRIDLRRLEYRVTSVLDTLHSQMMFLSEWTTETEKSINRQSLVSDKLKDILNHLLSSTESLFWEFKSILNM